MIAYYFTMQYYRRTSRELQRLDSISRSPIFNLFSETLSGVEVIRAYDAVPRFVCALGARTLPRRISDVSSSTSSSLLLAANDRKINYNQRAYWIVQVTNRWLSLRLEFLGNLITFSAALFAVIGKANGVNPCPPAYNVTFKNRRLTRHFQRSPDSA